MLILERKVEEEIIINDNIVIKVCKISKSKVKLSIEAPKDISIIRKELVDGSR